MQGLHLSCGLPGLLAARVIGIQRFQVIVEFFAGRFHRSVRG